MEFPMGKQRSSFAKLQRDRAKAAKKAAKMASRHGKDDNPYGPLATGEAPETPEPVDQSDVVAAMFAGKGELSAPELLAMIEEIHKKRDSGDMSEEEFEDAKVEIFARLPID
jgi:hypothetical protein